MKTKILFPVIASLALAAGLSSYQATAKANDKSPMILKERVAKRLELSDQQREQIKAIVDNAKKARSAEVTELKTLQQQWKELAEQSVLNEAELLSIAKQQANLKAVLKVERLKTQKEVEQVLNEEQKAKLEKFKEKRKNKRKNKRKERHEHRMSDQSASN